MKRYYRHQGKRWLPRNHGGELRSIFSILSLAGLSREVRIIIFRIFFVTGGLFSILSIAGYAGALGDYFSYGLSIAFGFTKFFFPLGLFCIAVFSLRIDDAAQRPHLLIQGCALLFFILGFTALWHLQYPVERAYHIALSGQGGGVTGFFFSTALQNVVGFWGALLIIIAIFLSTTFILFPPSFWIFFKSWKTKFYEVFQRIQKRNVDTRFAAAQRKKEIGDHEEDNGYSFPFFSKKALAQEEDKKKNHQVEPQKMSSAEHTGEMEVLKIGKRKINTQLSLDLLNATTFQPLSGDIKTNKLIIEKTLENFGISVEMGEVNVGPTVTQYTLKPSEGIKLSSITALQNDLSLALAAHPIRIEAPIPGRALVGIEVPNQKIAIVTLREILDSTEFKTRKSNLSLVLGKDVSGKPRTANLASMPHLLIAGSTGSGKTVCINTIITSLLFQNTPEDLRFVMVDPKRVELPLYNDIPHLLTPVITDVKKTLNALRWTLKEMERRFDLLSRCAKRDLASYNHSADEKLPYIVVIIDELADIMVSVGAEAESLIIRLAQMARAVGIHLILATQRPSVDVITGLIKANITSRIAFAVASQMDSRTILDSGGAEKLVGRGDMLYISSDLSKPVRIQGAYLADEEIHRVVTFLKESGGPTYETAVTEKAGRNASFDGNDSYDEEDEFLSEAREVVIRAKKASASLLQRRLRVGYARAARLLDLLEAQGVIGPADGARPRDVFVQSDDVLSEPEEDDSLETT